MVKDARFKMHSVSTLEDRIKLIQANVSHDMFDPEIGPKLRAQAIACVRACPIRGDVGQEQSDACELTSIFDFVVNNVHYVFDIGPGKDHEPVDLYQTPYRTLQIGGGDCFPVGTLLLRESGAMVPVEDITAGERIWGYNGWSKVIRAWSKGKLPVTRISLADGRSLHLSEGHKVYLTPTKRIHVSEVEVGMTLLTPDNATLVNRNPKVVGVTRGEFTVDCYDVSTEDHYVYSPEAGITVSNCDCVVALNVCLLRMIGWNVKARVTGTKDEWKHIYAVVKEYPKIGTYREVVFDTTLGHDKLGMEAPYERVRDFEI